MPRLTKLTAQERALKVVKGLKRSGGSQTKLAKKLGVTPQAVHKKTKRKECQSMRQQAIQRAAKNVGFTLQRIYGALNDSLDANAQASYLGDVTESNYPDHRARLVGVKIGLELFEHLGGDLVQDAKPTEIHVHYGHRTKPPQKEDDGN